MFGKVSHPSFFNSVYGFCLKWKFNATGFLEKSGIGYSYI